jgi:peptidoglycan/LPS O-acetylase OafA/YrhL
MASKRIHYIDWLRVLAVALLFPFHTGRVFNVGEPFYAKSAVTSPALSLLLSFIDLFHMPLLFLLAGASAYFALSRRSSGEFAKERTLRLAVPLLFGVLVIVPPQTWIGARTNAAYTGGLLEYLPRAFAVGPNGDLSGYFGGFTPAHLWFVLFLLLLSLAALPLMRYWRSGTGAASPRRIADRFASPLGLAALIVPLFVADALPDIAGKNPFYYLVYLAAGFLLMADDRWMQVIERWRGVLLAVGVVGGVATIALWGWRATQAEVSVGAAAFAVLRLGAGWALVAACLGFGKRLLDTGGRVLTYLAEASYPVYILHQTVIVVAAFLLLPVLPAGVWLPYAAILLVGVAVCFGLYEGVRRVGVLRFLFGMRPARRLRAA